MKVMLNTVANRWRFGAVLPAFAFVAFVVAVSSCGNYDPLPPKTEAATSSYIPAPETPTQDEIDEMKAERDEYSKLTK